MLYQKKLDTRQFIRIMWVSLGLWLLFGWAVPLNSSQLPSVREYQIKAVYLYNFANFVRWPRGAFKSSSAPFQICVLGEDPFRRQLDLAVENEKIGGRFVKVRRIHYIEESDLCQIVFVSQSKQRYRAHIFAHLKQRPILTVSDLKNFVVNGGMIQFYNRGNKVRFIIDPQTLKETGLKASARLLQIAKIAH